MRYTSKELGFSEAVTEAFRFLTDEFEFVCLAAGEQLVQYKSAKVWVHVSHQIPPGHLMVDIGRGVPPVGVEVKGFNEYEFLTGLGLSSEEVRTGSYITGATPEEVRANTRRLASLIKDAGRLALQGDDDAWTLLEAEVERIRSDYTARMSGKKKNSD